MVDLTRAEKFSQISNKTHFPVVIIGAGINGLGTFFDLVHQGIDCLIVDKGDFCSGTSAAPSRMIHGGLKYMETGEFGLVKESVLERNSLLKNAPHLVTPLELIIPIESQFGGVFTAVKRILGLKAKFSKRGYLVTKIGLTAYDIFSRKNKTMPNHRMMSAWELKSEFPGISGKARYGASYYDARISMPERLGMELAQDGMLAHEGAIALNYCSMEGIENGAIKLKDEICGKEYHVSANVVINAGGPWIDEVNSSLNHQEKLVSGAKGSHILLDLPILFEKLKGRMIYFDPGDGRICLVSTLAGKVLLGSTDIPVSSPNGIRCEDSEIDYMFDALHRLFPMLKFSQKNIVFTYSGVRPLQNSDAPRPGDVTRDHRIHKLPSNGKRPFVVLSLIGGKWTTFRSFSKEATDLTLLELGKARKSQTESIAIGGGVGFSNSIASQSQRVEDISEFLGTDFERATILINRYGSRVKTVCHKIRAQQNQFDNQTGFFDGEIVHYFETEMATGLCDILMRRTNLAISGKVSKKYLDDLSAQVHRVIKIEKATLSDEIAEFKIQLKNKHRIDIETGQLCT